MRQILSTIYTKEKEPECSVAPATFPTEQTAKQPIACLPHTVTESLVELSATPRAPTTFPRFMELPAEHRIQIWEQAILCTPVKRYITLDECFRYSASNPPQEISELASIVSINRSCYEAHEIVKKHIETKKLVITPWMALSPGSQVPREIPYSAYLDTREGLFELSTQTDAVHFDPHLVQSRIRELRKPKPNYAIVPWSGLSPDSRPNKFIFDLRSFHSLLSQAIQTRKNNAGQPRTAQGFLLALGLVPEDAPKTHSNDFNRKNSDVLYDKFDWRSKFVRDTVITIIIPSEPQDLQPRREGWEEEDNHKKTGGSSSTTTHLPWTRFNDDHNDTVLQLGGSQCQRTILKSIMEMWLKLVINARSQMQLRRSPLRLLFARRGTGKVDFCGVGLLSDSGRQECIQCQSSQKWAALRR